MSSIQKGTKNTIRRAFSTSIGMQFVKGLDAAITTTEAILDRLERPVTKEPVKPEARQAEIDRKASISKVKVISF